MKIENSRLDIVSHKPYPKNELFRLVIRDKTVIVDENNNLPGRGFYIHKDEASVRKSITIITNKFNLSISEEMIDTLLKLI